jgi:hypothetical protein
MARRLSEKTRLFCYRMLVYRDGERCQLCGAVPVTRNNGFEPLILEIDHIDGDPHNWQEDDLRLLCKSCNLAARNRASCAPRRDSACKEREREEGRARTRVVRAAVDYSSPEAPVTMQANFLFEVDVRAWILKKVTEGGFYSKPDAIAAAAEVHGCSPQAVRNYLSKLTSSAGPLQERKDMLGGWMLEFKPEYRQAALTPQESHQAAFQISVPVPGRTG